MFEKWHCGKSADISLLTKGWGSGMFIIAQYYKYEWWDNRLCGIKSKWVALESETAIYLWIRSKNAKKGAKNLRNRPCIVNVEI